MDAESSPKIVIVDESPIRAAILEEGLREAGFTGVIVSQFGARGADETVAFVAELKKNDRFQQDVY